MKRFLCLALCLVLTCSLALAETADTLPKRFVRQLTGVNGARGYMSVTASGIAEWLNYLLPFTATDIQIRAVGEKQGEMSETVLDDDDWQVRFYANNSEGEEVGTTWLFGNPEGIYFKSELLPDVLLNVPVENVHLLYQVFQGEFSELFFAFDPMGMKAPGANGNASAYEAVAEVFGIPSEEWKSKWLPVLEKYFLQLDLWLTGFGDPSFMTGESGSLALSAAYTIPAEELKKEAKYIIGQMLYDTELQNLLLPHVTMEQRITYLNPQMLYFYEACIDAIILKGDLVLSREMSSLGEVISTQVTLPLPAVPQTLVGPVGEALAALFELPYNDLLTGMNQLTISQKGKAREITLRGEKRTITAAMVETNPDADTAVQSGTIRITPSAGIQEEAVSAEFSCTYGHRIWQDEKYLNRDTTTFALQIKPALDMLGADDPFRSSYVDFHPVSVSCTVDYRNQPHDPNQAEKPVQVNLDLDLQLPDAEVSATLIMRITKNVVMVEHATAGASDYATLSLEQKNEIRDTFIANAIQAMSNLNVAKPAPADASDDAASQ